MWPSFGPTCSLGSNLGPSWVQHSATWRIVPTERGMLKTRATATAISLLFFASMLHWRFVQLQLASHGLDFRHLDHNLRPNMPKLRHLDPNLRPNMPKLRDLGSASWAQAGACSAQFKAKYGQVRPQQGQVGLKKARVQPASPAAILLSLQLRARPGQFPSPTSSKRLEYPHTFCIPLIYYPYTDCILLISSLQILLYFLH